MRISRRHRVTVFGLVLLLTASLPALAVPVLYGVTGSFSISSLYTVDPVTGATTLVGATGTDHITGIDFDPTSGTLYGVRSDFFESGATQLLTLNAGTGAATVVGTTGSQIPDITIGPDGVLRGWARAGIGNNDLAEIDKATGATTITASVLGTNRTGVATRDAMSLYVMAASLLYSVDVTTGAGTFLFNDPGSNANNILENMPGGDLLYGERIGGSGTQFYSMNPTTGFVTTLGFASGVEFSAVAYSTVVPLPPAILLLWSGVVGLMFRRRVS